MGLHIVATMCFGSRKKEEADATRSRELDKILKADEKRMAKEVKLLLLGTLPPWHASNLTNTQSWRGRC